jgi:membrane protease subunit HflC
MAQTGPSHMNVLLRRSLPAVIAGGVAWAVASSLFTVDATEYALVTRFGRVARVVSTPGLYITAPFDRSCGSTSACCSPARRARNI